MVKSLIAFFQKQYTNIGGQAVIEGVLMRSPHAFVVAVRLADGKIRLRKDQWFGLADKFKLFKKPFLRGVLVLIESMANGIVGLNYSANLAMDEEEKQKLLAKAKKKGLTEEEFLLQQKSKEKVNWATFLSIGISFVFAMGLFVFLPHGLTALLEKFLGASWDLNGVMFHAVDGFFKAMIFILYIFLIGLIPDIRRVFQYHGAEHMAIYTFENKEKLTVENARKYTTLHPRCGTSFIFFLLFISIIIFSMIFTIININQDLPWAFRHLLAIVYKIFFIIPIAGVSYEVIKFAGKYKNNVFCKALSFPGMMLQKLTTRVPDDKQLEVALASIKAVLILEEKNNLKSAQKKLLKLEEADISNVEEMESTHSTITDFLEV